MTLTELQINNLRNISSLRLYFHPHLNIITGSNGSGKTSLIEALYLLGTGCSFRANDVSSLVAHSQNSLTVFAKTDDFQSISIQKSIHSPTVALINGESCNRRSELASFLPCQIFYQDIFQLMDAGPSLRRSLLDWGLFHVEQDYHLLWKDYRRVLKQRNSLLKQKVSYQQMLHWDTLLASLACQLDERRAAYFSHLYREFDDIVTQLTEIHCSLSYYKGWDKKNEGVSLESVLQSTLKSDCLRQYTHYGAHHADFSVISNEHQARHYLSRGQQKMVLFALKFAQARLMNRSCIFLVDDMCAELDENHIRRLMAWLYLTRSQVFITARPGDVRLLNLQPETYSQFILEYGVPGSVDI